MPRRMTLATAVVLGLVIASAGGALGQPARTCRGLAPTIVGDGSEVIYGTGGRDVIVHTYDVAETIYGFGGDDVICAGHADVVYAGAGNDVVVAVVFRSEAVVGDATVYGGPGDDLLVGGIAYGEAGNDWLFTPGSAYGGAGNDLFFGEEEPYFNYCDGGSGTDAIVSDTACRGVQVNIP